MTWQEYVQARLMYDLITTVGGLLAIVLVIGLIYSVAFVRDVAVGLSSNVADKVSTSGEKFAWQLRLKMNWPPAHWYERERFDRERAEYLKSR